MFNAHHEAVEFTMPEAKWGDAWGLVLNTAEETDHMSEDELGPELEAAGRMPVQPWSLVLLKRIAPK
jgi:glycogen operon protein